MDTAANNWLGWLLAAIPLLPLVAALILASVVRWERRTILA